MSESYSHWYLKNIEPGIRPIVKALRDNGINTYYSCEHAMVIEAEGYDINDNLVTINKMLQSCGYYHYLVEVTYESPDEGQRYKHIRIMLPMKDGMFCIEHDQVVNKQMASKVLEGGYLMADRTSAGLFGKIFDLLAKNLTEEHKEIAQEVYSYTGEYDFSDYQMCADDACLKLGIARKGINPEYPDEEETVLWPNDCGYEDVKHD